MDGRQSDSVAETIGEMSVDGWFFEDREIDEAGCDSFGDGAGVMFQMTIWAFQASPSRTRIPDQ